ncbi:CHRD domain-containing protein [Rubellimicrobium roseum]|nr:CHRD domain-containing protein [Rubellimicrobium roseum]
MLAVSAEAATISYVATLSGPAEVPPNTSAGTGSSTVTIDTVARTFGIEFTFANLLAPTTAAHIHGPTAGPGTGTAGVITAVPFFPGFLTGVTSGSYEQIFDLTDAATFNPDFVTSAGGLPEAETAFLAALASGSAYLNIHSTQFPAGEIRGFYQPTPAPIPLPATLPLLGAVLGLGFVLRRRRT